MEIKARRRQGKNLRAIARQVGISQGSHLFEHRDRSLVRRVVVHLNS